MRRKESIIQLTLKQKSILDEHKSPDLDDFIQLTKKVRYKLYHYNIISYNFLFVYWYILLQYEMVFSL